MKLNFIVFNHTTFVKVKKRLLL